MAGNDERTNSQLSLGERIKKYYHEELLSDGRGGILYVMKLAELAPGVVSVLDSLDEIDIFFDLNKWKVATEVQGSYSLFLEGVRKNAFKNTSKIYELTAIAESAWHPFYARSCASFAASFDAAKVYLKLKNNEDSLQWYESPKIVNNLRLLEKS